MNTALSAQAANRISQQKAMSNKDDILVIPLTPEFSDVIQFQATIVL
jgi:hypothetical protein